MLGAAPRAQPVPYLMLAISIDRDALGPGAGLGTFWQVHRQFTAVELSPDLILFDLHPEWDATLEAAIEPL